MASITPAKMATPPSRGIGVLCTFRPPGVSTSPLAMAIRRTIGVTIKVTRAPIAAMNR